MQVFGGAHIAAIEVGRFGGLVTYLRVILDCLLGVC
jgi:hypothetical protein